MTGWHRLLVVGLLTVSLGSAGNLMARDEAASAADFSAYQSTVAPGVVLAGALDLQKLRDSHRGDIRIIDLRTEAEGTPEEAAAAGALGLSYANIPVAGALIEPGQVAELRGLLDAAQPGDLVVVHCGTGNRAGMLWGAAELERGVPLETVLEDVSGVVTKEPISDALEAYAAERDAGL